MKNQNTPKKKLSVSVLKKRADAAFSKYVRYRDSVVVNGERVCECITCGIRRPLKEMQNGHFVSRRVNALRFDEENCNAQCYSCNVMRYGEQYAYAQAVDLKYGDGTADKLHSQRFSTHKFTILELEEIIAEANKQVKWYETGVDDAFDKLKSEV